MIFIYTKVIIGIVYVDDLFWREANTYMITNWNLLYQNSNLFCELNRFCSFLSRAHCVRCLEWIYWLYRNSKNHIIYGLYHADTRFKICSTINHL